MSPRGEQAPRQVWYSAHAPLSAHAFDAPRQFADAQDAHVGVPYGSPNALVVGSVGALSVIPTIWRHETAEATTPTTTSPAAPTRYRTTERDGTTLDRHTSRRDR
jgi:hypothetical protein